ncbi:hypothetical protein PI125_g21810 [Phytophthora idaei]|nr:hypothetical protein PI125_g21810 [Phytophthora idaei]KAG3131492.1 hypothetical protein PI126_g20030 [Phytophthora idaei]
MAMHAREMVFVLDVKNEESTRVQAYGYQEVAMPDNSMVETGVVVILPTTEATHQLRDLIAAETLPIVMVLNYNNTGNHCQAVTYDSSRYQVYTERWKELTER